MGPIVVGILIVAAVAFMLVQMFQQNRRLFWSVAGAAGAHVVLAGLLALVALVSGHLHGPLKLVAVAAWITIFLGLAGYGLYLLYFRSRVLFATLLIALGVHLSLGISVYAIGHFMNRKPQERYTEVQIAKLPPPPEEKKKEPEPEPKKDMNFEVPLGDMKGDPNVTKIRKGTVLKPLESLRDVGKNTNKSDDPNKKPNSRKYGERNYITTPVDGDGGDIQDTDIGPPDGGEGGEDPNIRPWEANDMDGGGGGGNVDWGVPYGDPNGGVPRGFPDGKVGGKVYFLRLKTENNGAWNAYNEGTKKLLNFFREDASLKLPCHTDTWPIDSKLLSAYLEKGDRGVPSFVYIYADEQFALGGNDVALLKKYINMNGFLFIDSRPSLAIKEKVANELRKVFPATPLAPIPEAHPIRTFHFEIQGSGTGQNIVDGQNYGITKDGRLVTFYTMGNFSHLYDLRPYKGKDVPEFVTGTYQMGANVMLYAIRKGKTDGMTKVKGANATVTLAMLEKLGALTSSSTPTVVKPNTGNTAGSADPVRPPDVPVAPPDVDW